MILLDGYRKMSDQSFSTSKDLGDILRFLPGVVVWKHTMCTQGMADLYRITPGLLRRLIPPVPATYWLTICLVSCRTETVLSFITAIPFFNIFLFAVIFYFYWMDQLPLTFSRRSSVYFELSFFKISRSSHELSDYVNFHFSDHLSAATTGFLYAQNIDDHPAVEFLHDLETRTYYVDENLSGYILARCIFHGYFEMGKYAELSS